MKILNKEEVSFVCGGLDVFYEGAIYNEDGELLGSIGDKKTVKEVRIAGCSRGAIVKVYEIDYDAKVRCLTEKTFIRDYVCKDICEE